MRRQRSSFESSFNHDATTDNLDLNVANEDADQEIGANPVNQSSSLERNTGLLLRNTRRRTNPATDQDFLNSRLSSASPVYSSQLFQPSYQNWVTSPSSTSNPANFHFVASNSSYGYQRQENSQYAPGITTMQSMLLHLNIWLLCLLYLKIVNNGSQFDGSNVLSKQIFIKFDDQFHEFSCIWNHCIVSIIMAYRL